MKEYVKPDPRATRDLSMPEADLTDDHGPPASYLTFLVAFLYAIG